MPFVTVEMTEGRTPEQKKQLVADINAAFVKMGVRPEATYIALHDVPRQNFAVGGQMLSERK
ncbi:MAG: 4-oxalocrotonate tautomerase family protein [Chloroflexi bacterium]|nr:4-oxalocrotonate tautomerase family protein [Chloroflexota bacterium]